MLKIYIAGPDVFFDKAKEIGEIKKSICSKYGFIGIFPLDLLKEDLFSGKYSLDQQAKIIKNACKEGIQMSDILVANLIPFRGISMDVGTACEIGMADMADMPIFGYSSKKDRYIDKIINADLYKKSYNNLDYDIHNHLIENFNKIDNCMVTESCIEIFFPLNQKETDLEIFERMIKTIAEKNET